MMMEHTKGPFAPKPEHKPWPGHGCELFADKIRQALDDEPWEDAEHNTDSYGQERRLYIGSVFGCTPSGKFYMPWACSNVMGCDSCKGTGSVLMVKSRVAKRRKSKWLHSRRVSKRYRDRPNYMAPGPLYVHRERRDAKHAQRMRLYHLDNASTRQCTACGGSGSREAHLDELWREYAESVCESVGASLSNGDGDACDLFVVEYRDKPDDETTEGETDVSEAQPA